MYGLDKEGRERCMGWITSSDMIGSLYLDMEAGDVSSLVQGQLPLVNALVLPVQLLTKTRNRSAWQL